MSEQASHPAQNTVFESEDYRLLVGHHRTDGSLKSDEQLRSEYIHRTDELVRMMTEGVAIWDKEAGETVMKRPDYVIWLDKSARPVAWLTKELWPKLAPAPGEEMPEMPEFRFVNIDREQWVNTVDPNGSGYMDIDRVDKSVIRSLRSIFIKPEHKREGLSEALDSAPAELDDKTILIIDEVMSTGRTLDIARKFFGRAFPTAEIAAAHWMGGQAQIGLATGNADLPVWYKEKTETGRGVANRNEKESQNSKSLTQRLGGWFLSTRFAGIEPDSKQLRTEIHNLAHDDKVLIVPSYGRDDFEARAEALNGIPYTEVIERKREQEAKR